MWFFIALAGYFVLAVVLVLDKIIVSESRVAPVVYTFYSTIIALPALLIVPLFGSLPLSQWGIAALSGIAFGIGLWGTFLALEHDEASHIGPFGGALITVCIAGLSFFFLHETLSGAEQAGVLTLLFASLLLSYEKTRGRQRFHQGFLWAGLAAIFFAISHTSAKYLYDLQPFVLAMFATKGTAGILGICLLISPRVRSALSVRAPRRPKSFKRRHPMWLIGLDKLFGVAGVILVQYAIALGSVTIVNALAGVQYIFLFFLVVVLTRFSPSVFREYITKREYAIQTIAVLLAALGSAFVVL